MPPIFILPVAHAIDDEITLAHQSFGVSRFKMLLVRGDLNVRIKLRQPRFHRFHLGFVQVFIGENDLFIQVVLAAHTFGINQYQ